MEKGRSRSVGGEAALGSRFGRTMRDDQGWYSLYSRCSSLRNNRCVQSLVFRKYHSVFSAQCKKTARSYAHTRPCQAQTSLILCARFPSLPRWVPNACGTAVVRDAARPLPLGATKHWSLLFNTSIRKGRQRAGRCRRIGGVKAITCSQMFKQKVLFPARFSKLFPLFSFPK